MAAPAKSKGNGPPCQKQAANRRLPKIGNTPLRPKSSLPPKTQKPMKTCHASFHMKHVLRIARKYGHIQLPALVINKIPEYHSAIKHIVIRLLFFPFVSLSCKEINKVLTRAIECKQYRTAFMARRRISFAVSIFLITNLPKIYFLFISYISQ